MAVNRPDTPERVPFLRPEMPEIEVIVEDLAAIYRSHQFSNGGAFEEKLAGALATYLGVRFCVPVANATLGLMVAVNAVLRCGRANKFLVPSFTFAASALAAEWRGLEPVFCDIDPQTWQATVDADTLYARRDEFALIVLCNTFGAPADIAFWKSLAARCDIPMIMDSAAGLGASYADGTGFGQAGHLEVFSMHATKAFGIGEGGVVVTDDPEMYRHLRALKDFGLDGDRNCAALGINAKLSEFHAAIACRVLEHYPGILSKRRAIAAHYRERLEPHGFVFQRHGELSAYPFVSARVPAGASRLHLRQQAECHGIEIRQYFSPPLHHQPRYRACESLGDLAVTNGVANAILSLPISNSMSAATVDRICDCLVESLSPSLARAAAGE